MRGKSHLITGIVSGTASAVMFFDGNISKSIAIAGAATLTSLIPDIDLPASTVGKKVKLIAKIINKMFGHRTITHAPIWLIPLFLLYLKTPELMTGYSEVVVQIVQGLLFGYMIGFFTHLFGDLLTKGGIPFCYPFSKKRFRLSWSESGKHDGVFIVITSLFVLGMLFLVKYCLLKYT